MGPSHFYERLRTENCFDFSVTININQNSAVNNFQLFENLSPMSGFRTVINCISLHQTFWGHALLKCHPLIVSHTADNSVTHILIAKYPWDTSTTWSSV